MGSVYLVKTDIQNDNPNIQITAGLTGTVEIKTGTRSVMEYFLEPIVEGVGNSLKEKYITESVLNCQNLNIISMKQVKVLKTK